MYDKGRESINESIETNILRFTYYLQKYTNQHNHFKNSNDFFI